jgi:hypothetical protein
LLLLLVRLMQVFVRDLMTVRVWDLAMTRAPVRVIDVADSLRPRLSELWETERIFDRFEIAVVRRTSLRLPLPSHSRSHSHSHIHMYRLAYPRAILDLPPGRQHGLVICTTIACL